jgi:hypothetical protein
MPAKIFGPRKRRTRQHVIADLAVHCVEGFILDEGHIAERKQFDYGYDLTMTTFDEQGYAEPELVFFQVKASERLKEVGETFFQDIDLRDYHLWMRERTPVVLVLYDASRREAYWLDVRRYFAGTEPRRPKTGAKWARENRQESGNESAGHCRIAPSQGDGKRIGGYSMFRPTEITYGQLDKVLRSFGFSRRVFETDGKGVRYEHQETGARITLPWFPNEDHVLDHHLAAVRLTLENFGVAAPSVFEAKLKKAG